MVRMYKRANGKLYLEYELHGRIVQKSTRLPDTPQNRALVKREVIPALERKLILGDIGAEKPKDFSYYSQEYLKDKSHLKSFPQVVNKTKLINKHFGSRNVAQIKRSDIKAWVNNRLKVNSPKTVREYLTVIRGILAMAIDHEHLTHNVAEGIKLPRHHKAAVEPFSPEEVTQLLHTTNDWLQLYLAIGFYTGLRSGEILGLMAGDIDLDTRVIHIRRNITKGKITTPKTEKSIREVPILDDLVPYLKKLPKSLWLFPSKSGQHPNSFPGYRQRQWRDLLQECGIQYRKIYATRHTFIVSMLKYTDLSILEIAQIAGHTSTQMIIQNYGQFIKGEHLKIDRSLKLFTGKSTGSLG